MSDLPPGTRAVQIGAADLNGQARGKRAPAGMAPKLMEGGARMPLSVLNVDLAGDDIEGSPLVFASGDADGLLRPTGRGPIPIPWLDTPTALIPAWMFREDGRPFEGDPRQALARVLERFAALGLAPQVATEWEFHLIDDAGEAPRPAASPRSGRRRMGGDILSLRALDAFDAILTGLYDGAEAIGVPAQAAISEAGLGQFEIDIAHQDAMRAADDAWLFKLMVKGLARRHGLAGSFLAKPWPDHAGSGFHAHVSLLDAAGRNVFDDGGAEGTPMLRHAVAGCLDAMAPSTLIFAPHGSSYDRLVPEAHAPTAIAWAHENRTAAIRIPGGDPANRRLEHRVAGADTNPYLVLAAILGAMLAGIEDEAQPPPAVTGNAYAQDLPGLPADWGRAIALLRAAPQVARLLPGGLIRNYLATKRQEAARWAELDASARLALSLDAV